MRICFIAFILILNFACAQDAPKPLTQEERSPEWLLAIERLRTLPRAGDIQNAAILANIGDVIETTPEQRAAITEVVKAYDAAIVQKAAQWENELKAIRSEYDAKIVAALPEARREAAKKIIEYSHEQWATPFEFHLKMRVEFMQRKSKLNEKDAPPPDASKKDMVGWIKSERQKYQEKNAEVTKALKGMLDPKEAERLDQFDKNREVKK